MSVKLKTNNGKIELTQTGGKVIRGVDGGYYTPVIDAEGNLSWIASLTDMEDVAAVNIKGAPGKDGEKGEDGQPGEKGEKGESGVYVGTTEPTDNDMLIWINPEGGASAGLATTDYVDSKIPDVSKFQTEEQVNALINSALEEVENGTY